MVVTALVLAACTSWHAMPGGIDRASPRPLPNGLRITRTDGSRVMMLSPHCRGDTLYGHWYGDTVAVPLEAIRQVEREQFSVVRTLAVVVGAPVAVVGTLYVIQCGDGGCRKAY